MGINIVNQTNELECGVCVITSLHNHYYPYELVTKEKILDHSNITPNGMSIFDLEVLARQTGLECESYEVNWQEFINLKINNYFIVLTSTPDGQSNHYVIARKKNKYIEIYDSCCLEVKKLKYNDFKKVYMNVLILVNKKPNKTFNKVFGKATNLLLFDLKFVLINILLSLLILGVSILSASFLNWIIDISITKSSIKNLITISFIFLLIYFLNDLLNYISSLYSSAQLKNYYILFTDKILKSLQNKKSNFLNKVDKNWIYKVDECVYSISSFCIVEVNKLVTNCIFGFICICIIGSLQPWLLFFTILFALVETIPFLFSYRKKKEMFISIVRSENKNAQFYKQLIQSISFEQWYNKRNSLIGSIKKNYSSIYKNFNDAILFKSNNTLVKSLLKSFVEIASVVLIGYLIIKQNALSIGKLTFLVSAFSLYKNSIAEICNYFLVKLEFNVYWQVYKDITNVSNLNEKKLLPIDFIKTLTIKCNNKSYKLISNKSNKVDTSAFTLINNAEEIKINEQLIDLNSKQLNQKIIVLDEMTTINLDYFMELLEKDPVNISRYIRHFKIDINAVYSHYECLVINLICLAYESNSIILIDQIMSLIKKQDEDVINEILNIIQKNNSVFILQRENNG